MGLSNNELDQISVNGSIPLGDGSVKLGGTYNPSTGIVGAKVSNSDGSLSYSTNGVAEIGVKLGDGLNGVASTGPGGSSAGIQYTIPLGGGPSTTANPVPSASGVEAFSADVPIGFGPGVLNISEPVMTGDVSLGPDFVSITSPTPDGLFNNSSLLPGAGAYFTDFSTPEAGLSGASSSASDGAVPVYEAASDGGVTFDESGVEVFGDPVSFTSDAATGVDPFASDASDGAVPVYEAASGDGVTSGVDVFVDPVSFTADANTGVGAGTEFAALDLQPEVSFFDAPLL